MLDMGYCDDWKTLMDDREANEVDLFKLDCDFTWIVGNIDPTTQVTTAWEVGFMKNSLCD
jgi:hypothetical protein